LVLDHHLVLLLIKFVQLQSRPCLTHLKQDSKNLVSERLVEEY
jgi:hypothetical protein